jgi:hypothetical protein
MTTIPSSTRSMVSCHSKAFFFTEIDGFYPVAIHSEASTRPFFRHVWSAVIRSD